MYGDEPLPIGPYFDDLGVQFRYTYGNQKVRCPFHGQDRSPSASLNLGKGLFNCFTCGAGGTAVTLMMTQEGMSREDAVRRAEDLAEGAGEQVQRRSRREPGRVGVSAGGTSRVAVVDSGWRSPWRRH